VRDLQAGVQQGEHSNIKRREKKQGKTEITTGRKSYIGKGKVKKSAARGSKRSVESPQNKRENKLEPATAHGLDIDATLGSETNHNLEARVAAGEEYEKNGNATVRMEAFEERRRRPKRTRNLD